MCMVAFDSLTPGSLTHSLVNTISQYRKVNSIDESPNEIVVNVDRYLSFDQLMEVQHIIRPESVWNDNIKVFGAVENGYDVRIQVNT